MQKNNPSQSIILKSLVVLAYTALFFFLINNLSMFTLFLIGVLCGVGFLVADDRYFYLWYIEGKEKFLVTRSPLFLISLLPLVIMVLTSFGSFWASGVMGGMLLWLLLEMLELKAEPEAFQKRFLRGAKVDNLEQVIFTILLVGWFFFLIIHLLTIF